MRNVKEELIQVLMQRLDSDPRDWALAEFISEVEGDAYTEKAMIHFIESEKSKVAA